MNYINQTEHPVYSFDKSGSSVLTIKSGESVTFRTADVVERELALLHKSKAEVGNKLIECVGPVYVEGARPGDTLAIHIEDMKLADRGIVVIKPNMGLLGDKIKQPYSRVTPIFNNHVQFTDTIKLPLRPMIGIIGVAPEHDPIPCVFPGTHGGNLDTLEVTTGNTLYLPVFVTGALLSVGDVHAAMGDGEVCLTAIETQATVKLKIDLIRNQSLKNPKLESPTDIITIASADTMEAALRLAVEDMIELIKEARGLSWEDALMLISTIGDAKISQVVNPYPTIRVSMPKSVLFE